MNTSPHISRGCCLCVCVCVCVCACMYVHAHVCTCFHVRMGLCIQVHMRGCHNKQNSTCYRGVDQQNPFCFSLTRKPLIHSIISVVLCYKPIFYFLFFFFTLPDFAAALHSQTTLKRADVLLRSTSQVELPPTGPLEIEMTNYYNIKKCKIVRQVYCEELNTYLLKYSMLSK